MKVGIVGVGVVGSSMQKLFSGHHELFLYDKFISAFNAERRKDSVNSCDIVFVCVNTPTAEDGMSADLSAIKECLSWITAPVCLRSTVPPGTTNNLRRSVAKRIAFCPEHLRETSWDAFKNEFIIVGGEPTTRALVILAFKAALGAQTRYVQTDATTAELSKYMLNCYLATKVAFCNQFFDIAQSYGVDYNELRELWLLDDRIGRTHTMITQPLRAFGGKCFPKDMRAMVAENPEATILKAALEYNKTLPGDGR
jgi:UDPglucose 6-dehydrogenase